MKSCLGLGRLSDMESEGQILISCHRPLTGFGCVVTAASRPCRIGESRLSHALSPLFSLSFLSLCPSFLLFLSFSLYPSLLHPRRPVRRAGHHRAQRCKWLERSASGGTASGCCAPSSRCRQRPQLLTCISEASTRALPPALPYALSVSSQARLPPPTEFILGGTRPSAWQVTRKARVFPRRRPQRDPGVQQLQPSPLQGPELAEWAGLGHPGEL